MSGIVQNTSSSWDTEVPSVSPCFEHTALVWLPCSVAWLLGLCEACILAHRDDRANSYSGLFLTKLVLPFWVRVIGFSGAHDIPDNYLAYGSLYAPH
ncbi:hypothetical protein HPB52_024059 [Rhipicephalus sanguineus]|uniref:Uncharacterized protein n=1 Tax=Rhipicephalus sanguineus TaxID=34632 RepID=A0A9D4Q812_RHISA|nr:hypothetical protein HPB52_024059 [Rhipicephalus sanguineus]